MILSAISRILKRISKTFEGTPKTVMLVTRTLMCACFWNGFILELRFASKCIDNKSNAWVIQVWTCLQTFALFHGVSRTHLQRFPLWSFQWDLVLWAYRDRRLGGHGPSVRLYSGSLYRHTSTGPGLRLISFTTLSTVKFSRRPCFMSLSGSTYVLAITSVYLSCICGRRSHRTIAPVSMKRIVFALLGA